MEMDLGIFAIYIGVIVMFFVFGKLFYLPVKVALKLMANSLFAGILLMIINVIGETFNVFVPINVLNACIVGILGLPGLIMLLILTS